MVANCSLCHWAPLCFNTFLAGSLLSRTMVLHWSLLDMPSCKALKICCGIALTSS